ncbi:MAG: sulfurtransferase TusA family protein [bacterium]|nr:sulfurtransferase TusA family protein [bacterium]
MNIDACGLSCPEPVIQTLKAINAGAVNIEVLVDNTTAMENVKRLAGSKGFSVLVEPQGELFMLKLNKNQA